MTPDERLAALVQADEQGTQSLAAKCPKCTGWLRRHAIGNVVVWVCDVHEAGALPGLLHTLTPTKAQSEP